MQAREEFEFFVFGGALNAWVDQVIIRPGLTSSRDNSRADQIDFVGH